MSEKKIRLPQLQRFYDNLISTFFTPMSAEIDGLNEKIENLSASEYSNTHTYSVGDTCMYENKLYECIVAITTPEDWNEQHWQLIELSKRVIPKGGSVGQVLAKKTANDFDVEWINVSGSEGAIIDDEHKSSSTTWSSTKIATEILNKTYPIGSIYMSVNNTNPSTLFGGTWEQIKDRFLLGCSGDVGSYPNGNIGGEKTHTLTINEIPSHTHAFSGNISGTTTGITNYMVRVVAGNGLDTNANHVTGYAPDTWFEDHYYPDNNIQGFNHTHNFIPSGSNSYVGGNAPHNIMPPYLAVYIWKRIG